MTAALKIINSSLFPQSDHTNWSPQGVSHSGAHPGHPESDLFTGGRVQEGQPRASSRRTIPNDCRPPLRHSQRRLLPRTLNPAGIHERKLAARSPIGGRQQGDNQRPTNASLSTDFPSAIDSKATTNDQRTRKLVDRFLSAIDSMATTNDQRTRKLIDRCTQPRSISHVHGFPCTEES